MGVPRVSVVVPVFEQPNELAACLRHLAAQELDGQEFEVLVVDNGSRYAIPEVAPEGLAVRWLREEAPGSYAARNRGLAASDSELVAFTDADCRPRSNWLRAALAALDSDSTVSMVGGAVEVVAEDPTRPTAVEAYELVKAFPQERYVADLNFAATANMVARRRVFHAVGGFNQELRSGGDREWGQRAAAAGFRWAFVPGAAVEHPARRSLVELNRKLARTAAGSRDLRVRQGLPVVTTQEVTRGLVPPVGALRRSRSTRLPNAAARTRYVLCEVFVRYVGTFHRLKTCWSSASPRS